jgi:membrane associated rhomboid family serine protease
MTTTPVGMRCPECAKQRTQVRRMRDMPTGPQVTIALIAINVVVFLTEGGHVFTLGGGSATGSVIREGALLGSSDLPPLAGKGVAHGEYWRLITGGFLHASILHIAFNMWVLYYLGTLLEPALGRVRFTTLYFVSLLTGSLGALIVSPHDITVGASGAVFGLMGAAAVETRARQIPLMQSGVGTLIVINLVISFTLSGISWGGHVGGLIGGALAAAALQAADRYRKPALGLLGCAAIASAAVAGSIVAAKSSEPESSAPAPTLVSPEGG